MADTLIAALSGEQVIQSNALATVTSHCVIVRTTRGNSEAIISLSRLTDVRKVNTSYPGLLVVAAGVFLIAAAAQVSKEGGPVPLPMAVLGLFFVAAYFWSRRASLVFLVDREAVESASGTLRQAAKLMDAVRAAKEKLERI